MRREAGLMGTLKKRLMARSSELKLCPPTIGLVWGARPSVPSEESLFPRRRMLRLKQEEMASSISRRRGLDS